MSQGMHAMLAAHYGTAPQPSEEDVLRAQQIDFFAKTAAANGIDLESLNQDQINWLWGEVFNKQAAEAEKKEEKEEKKEEKKEEDKEAMARKQAEAEFLQKKEAMAKIAEADFLGRVIAHAMWDENQKIAAAQAAQAKTAEPEDKKEEKEEKEEKKEEGGESLRDRLMAAAEKKEDKKEASAGGSEISAFDIKAAELAVQKIAASEYWPVETAVNRLNAVLTLGAKESTKVASAPNVDAALDIRSLELLEMAGYPIKWEG